jgi:hypothetical protein
VFSDPGPDLVQDDRPFGVLQFTADKVQSDLLELEVSKGAGHDGIPPLILKNCASTFEHPLSLFFLTYYICFSQQVETFLRDTDIQERLVQQRRILSWGDYIICNPEAF